jgi:hypothetical protein
MVERKGTFKKLEVMRHYPRNMTEREGIFKNLEVTTKGISNKRSYENISKPQIQRSTSISLSVYP